MKRILTLVLTLTLVLSLTGCLSDRDDDKVTVGEVVVLDALPTDDIQITFWHIYGQGKSALLDQMIADFELLYPNITVESVSQGSYADLLSKTKKAIGTGVTPDLVVGYPDHFAEYLTLGGLIPLDGFVKDETFGIDLTDYIDSYVAENQQYSDAMYSMPYSKSTEMLVYNKTLFDANNITFDLNEIVTWEELETYATTMVGSGANQCDFLINYDSASNLFINSSRQWGAPYTNIDGDILIDNATTKSMVSYFAGLMDKNILALPIEWEQSYGSTNFLAQDVCMTVGSTAGIDYNNPFTQLDISDRFEIGILPVPQFEGKTQSAMQQGPNIAVLANTTDAERLASWLLITFLTNSENTAAWARDTGYLPVTYSGYDTAAYQSFLTNPTPDYAVESLSANAAYASISFNDYDPAFAGIGQISSSKVREESGYAMEAVYAKTKTVEEAITEMLENLTW